MSQKVYRHLIEQRWRNEGALDLLVRCFNAFRFFALFNISLLDGASLPDARHT